MNNEMSAPCSKNSETIFLSQKIIFINEILSVASLRNLIQVFELMPICQHFYFFLNSSFNPFAFRPSVWRALDEGAREGQGSADGILLRGQGGHYGNGR